MEVKLPAANPGGAPHPEFKCLCCWRGRAQQTARNNTRESTYIHIQAHVPTRGCTNGRACLCAYVSRCTYACLRARMYACVRAFVHACTDMYRCIHTCIFKIKNLYVHAHIYVYTCIYMKAVILKKHAATNNGSQYQTTCAFTYAQTCTCT